MTKNLMYFIKFQKNSLQRSKFYQKKWYFLRFRLLPKVFHYISWFNLDQHIYIITYYTVFPINLLVRSSLFGIVPRFYRCNFENAIDF